LERKEFTMIIMPILLNPLSLLGAAMKNGQSHGGGCCKPEPAKPCDDKANERTINIEAKIKY
jgi:hypothetical protein